MNGHSKPKVIRNFTLFTLFKNIIERMSGDPLLEMIGRCRAP
jgi:hypothetical protein